MAIVVKSDAEIAIMRRAGIVVTDILQKLAKEAKPGIKTRLFDEVATAELAKHGATSSFKDYHGYPATVCVSINEQVVHGIPGERIIKEGDIVSLDFGAIVDGYHADAALTVGAGRISPEAKRLIDTTRNTLEAGIAAARAGARLTDISHAIQGYAESHGYSIVREYTGHAIGRVMHEDPQIPNFGPPGLGPVLRSGMTFALEPMVNIGTWKTRLKEDLWTVVTEDGSLSAHFEKTIAIREGAAEVLTPWVI